MSDAPHKFLLYCDAEQSIFVLAREDERWREQFADLGEALATASAMTREQAPLVVYNELGKIIAESTVSPLPAQSHEPLSEAAEAVVVAVAAPLEIPVPPP